MRPFAEVEAADLAAIADIPDAEITALLRTPTEAGPPLLLARSAPVHAHLLLYLCLVV